MAFAGCCELARTNIENDFGCSLQDNVDTWRRNAEKEHEMRVQCEELIEVLNGNVARHIAEKDALRESLKEAKDCVIADDLYDDLIAELEEGREIETRRIDSCIELLADFADCPHDIAVADALKGLSIGRKKKAKYGQLIERLMKCKWRK
jgi:hypothetical protein